MIRWKPTCIFLFLALATVTLVAGQAPPRPAEHVVLISIDGLRPEFYLEPTWPAPRLQQMAREGSHAEAVGGVFPSVTYPSHTTMVTGALPSRHGIHYNSPFEPGGQTGRWYWEAERIRQPTLWDAARADGLKTAALSWPVSVGAPIDWNLPEIWPLNEDDPIDVLRAASRPAGLWEEIEREATGRLTPENFTIDHMTRDDRAGDVAAYLLATHRPNLLLVHLIETDHFQHEKGREAPVVRRAVAAADRAVSQMVEAAERAGILESTAFIVTGDHGHVDRHSRLAPNVWLAEAGLLQPTDDRGDWRAVFHVAGAASFLHLAAADDAVAVAEVRRLLAELPAGVRRLFEVLDREALDALGAAPEAVLALNARPGVDFTADAEPPALRATGGATHGYVTDFREIYTGFVAWGAGIRRGSRVPTLDLVDVAPLVAHLLGVELEAPDGVLLPGLLRRSAKVGE